MLVSVGLCVSSYGFVGQQLQRGQPSPQDRRKEHSWRSASVRRQLGWSASRRRSESLSWNARRQQRRPTRDGCKRSSERATRRLHPRDSWTWRFLPSLRRRDIASRRSIAPSRWPRSARRAGMLKNLQGLRRSGTAWRRSGRDCKRSGALSMRRCVLSGRPRQMPRLRRSDVEAAPHRPSGRVWARMATSAGPPLPASSRTFRLLFRLWSRTSNRSRPRSCSRWPCSSIRTRSWNDRSSRRGPSR
mmetsp:Transcript_69687/g.151648  ORF Transcript_69687/g.151648 Transcript_69687/m.151648 type:complete len:245 (+) Transcript_69687:161-895(+)